MICSFGFDPPLALVPLGPNEVGALTPQGHELSARAFALAGHRGARFLDLAAPRGDGRPLLSEVRFHGLESPFLPSRDSSTRSSSVLSDSSARSAAATRSSISKVSERLVFPRIGKRENGTRAHLAQVSRFSFRFIENGIETAEEGGSPLASPSLFLIDQR